LKPLSNLLVLDFSKVLAGPLCTQSLGDLGADVIKVEAYPGGDDARAYPPFIGSDGTFFLSANRNKRSIALDLKTDAGRTIAHELARLADVVVESYGGGVAERLGVDYATLSENHAGLIYCSISGYGRTGPLGKAGGYDLMMQAFSGMMSITGEKGGGPTRSPFSPIDQTTGLHAYSGILAALLERGQTGKGCHVQVSLLDTSLSFLAYYFQAYWKNGTLPAKPGSAHDSICPYEAFPASDKHLILGVANDTLWLRFCEVAGLQHLANAPGFRTNAERVANYTATVAAVGAVIATRTCDEWIRILTELKIPCAPINSFLEVLNHPQTRATGMVIDYDHPSYGPMQSIAQPVLFDQQRNGPVLAPPGLGEHTLEILRKLGYSDTNIEHLLHDNVVFVNT
jgi:crotonobetainyl-CoA:carnitine CoA-transferase CaiB-like acyl-CoA transferase